MRKLLSVVIVLILLLSTVGFAEKPKSTAYRPYTPEEFVRIYQAQAMEEIITVLQKVTFAAQITEALQCPCYDITVSTKNRGVSIIRIDKGRCKDADNSKQERKGDNKDR